MLIREVNVDRQIHGEWCNEGKSVWLEVNLSKAFLLEDLTYRDIAKGSDPNFLMQKIRMEILPGVKFVDISGDTMHFDVKSSMFNKNQTTYINLVKFKQWDEIGQDDSLTPIERARLLLWISPIQLHCNCPAFKYWGMQYILTQLDASIEPEERFPKIRNPKLSGNGTCKHLAKTLRALGFYSGDIAKEIKKQFSGSSTGINSAINTRIEAEKEVTDI